MQSRTWDILKALGDLNIEEHLRSSVLGIPRWSLMMGFARVTNFVRVYLYMYCVCVYIYVSISIEREEEKEWTLKRRIFSYAHTHLFTVAERQALTTFS